MQVYRKMFQRLPDREEVIRDNLMGADIAIKAGTPPRFPEDETRYGFQQALPVPLYGELSGVIFRRTETHWLANGPIPPSVVLPFFEHKILREDVRVDDKSFCPPPDKAYFDQWTHSMDLHNGVRLMDAITVIKDEAHLRELKKNHPLDEYKGDTHGNCWYVYVPAGTHLKDGYVQLVGIYSGVALRAFAKELTAYHKKTEAIPA